MTEIEKIRLKYPNKDFIEVPQDVANTMLDWMGLKRQNDSRQNINDLMKKTNGFVKFLDSGVLLITQENDEPYYYPFEFTENGGLRVSIIVFNPESDSKDKELKTLCKVTIGKDMNIDSSSYANWDGKLISAHYENELGLYHQGKGALITIMRRFPHLEPEAKEVFDFYFSSITNAQIITVVAVNASLVLHEKNILISEHKRSAPRSNKKSNYQYRYDNRRNPFLRYIKVGIPANYNPRAFHYVLQEWGMSGYVARRWVRKENATILAARRGGKVLNIVDGDYTQIQIPIPPSTAHRKKGAPTQPRLPKIYTDN
jgi:hypothetical protein